MPVGKIRVERTRAGETWTEAQYWAFIRSSLREMSLRWPPRKLAKLAARRPYVGANRLQKWEYQCSACECWFSDKQVQVDHIEECGTLKTLDDLPVFVGRLLCEIDGLRVLCKPCHNERRDE